MIQEQNIEIKKALFNEAIYLKHKHTNKSILDTYSSTESALLSKILGSYQTLCQASSSHIAGRVAGTYMLCNGNPAAISGTGILYTPVIIPIYASDFCDITGFVQKLRIRALITVNNISPTGNFTVGLYPITSGNGGTGVKIYNVGTIVTGSTTPTVITPSGGSAHVVVSSDFSLPNDGLYCMAVLTTSTVANNSLVHIHSVIQTIRYIQ